VNFHLTGLTKDETNEYIKSRLESAGCFEQIFTDSAYELLFSNTNGSIKTLNSLVRMCLISGANEKIKSIDNELVFIALNELNIVA